MFSTNTWLAILAGLSVNAVIFGTGAVAVLSFPELTQYWKFLIPAVVVASFALSPFASVWVARRMRYRNWGRRAWNEGDAIS